MPLQVDIKKEKEVLTVYLSGDLDINTNKEFKEKVNSNLGDVKKITVDCENLSYVDSTGLGAFISIYKTVKEKKEKDPSVEERILIKNLKPRIKKIFLITDLDKVFTIEG